MNLSQLPIAMTDIETTGDVFGVHEILEIGLVLFDPITFEILDTYNAKTKPYHIENAIPKALVRNGYAETAWQDARELKDVIKIYADKTKGAIFCAYNATFDWGFMSNAFRDTGVTDMMDYHRLDLLTLAWERGLKEKESWSLKTACEMYGVLPEPEVHTALHGAMTAYELFKKLNTKK
jgi:DNA polymerase-3 subunit epsilon